MIPLRPELIEFMSAESLGRFASTSKAQRGDVREMNAWRLLASVQCPPRTTRDALEQDAISRMRAQALRLQEALLPVRLERGLERREARQLCERYHALRDEQTSELRPVFSRAGAAVMRASSPRLRTASLSTPGRMALIERRKVVQ